MIVILKSLEGGVVGEFFNNVVADATAKITNSEKQEENIFLENTFEKSDAIKRKEQNLVMTKKMSVMLN